MEVEIRENTGAIAVLGRINFKCNLIPSKLITLNCHKPFRSLLTSVDGAANLNLANGRMFGSIFAHDTAFFGFSCYLGNFIHTCMKWWAYTYVCQSIHTYIYTYDFMTHYKG